MKLRNHLKGLEDELDNAARKGDDETVKAVKEEITRTKAAIRKEGSDPDVAEVKPSPDQRRAARYVAGLEDELAKAKASKDAGKAKSIEGELKRAKAEQAKLAKPGAAERETADAAAPETRG